MGNGLWNKFVAYFGIPRPSKTMPVTMKDRILDWLSRLDEREMVPEEISALYVGMFETPEGYSLYLTGAVEYDADDDWACDQDYEPAEKYLPLPTSEIGEMGWEEFRKEAIAAVSEYIHKFPDSKMFNRIVAAGFDDGDLERIK